ncbi:aminoglycoside phosphotransferase family protein [Mangrovibrevibacter kandeliae]|uniref:aminoglycoside phosphotransferase family protein n=1 Tax=Mangrovibrevibacter kandeliae TaxID=2968473 RepID=UPI002117B74B|nr:aminoglycoside phosphotransferase family protein [Aurantimonas sp. CSK15Z-1]MCQ8782830.1 aminoglycoside phosphotransferase family protein [Aurantimonas sp. CSK15Z-1]
MSASAAVPGASAEILSAAETLLGEPILETAPAGKGANSHILRIDTPSRRLALKLYPRRVGDTRDRLAVEWQALTFLRGLGLQSVPAPLARDVDRRLMAMEWIEGPLALPHRPQDFDAALDFLTTIFAASHDAGTDSFPTASEACLSSAEILRQIEARLTLFVAEPMLDDFLEQTVRPRLVAARARLAAEADDLTPLAVAQRRLIPADFGFHNAIREPDGTLRFFDFDYFGWDDPVKLAADMILHPAMSFSPREEAETAARLGAALPDDPDFGARLARQLPLHALRWSLILLNLLRRDRAGELPTDDDERAARISAQIAKAQRMCERAGL